jgi:hypothetical protein
MNLSHFVDYIKAGISSRFAELEELATHEHHAVRARVAENPRTPRQTLDKLAKDESSEVRASLAGNPSAPLWMLRELTKDGSADVRYSLAEDNSMPKQILWILAEDENPYVAARAEKTLQMLDRPAVTGSGDGTRTILLRSQWALDLMDRQYHIKLPATA